MNVCSRSRRRIRSPLTPAASRPASRACAPSTTTSFVPCCVCHEPLDIDHVAPLSDRVALECFYAWWRRQQHETTPLTHPPEVSAGGGTTQMDGDDHDSSFVSAASFAQPSAGMPVPCATATEETTPTSTTVTSAQRLAHRALCADAQCARANPVCGPCWLAFVVRPCNNACPACRRPLDVVAAMCQTMVVQDERHTLMQQQNTALYDLFTGGVHRLRALHERACDEREKYTLDAMRVRLRPHAPGQRVVHTELDMQSGELVWRSTSAPLPNAHAVARATADAMLGGATTSCKTIAHAASLGCTGRSAPPPLPTVRAETQVRLPAHVVCAHRDPYDGVVTCNLDSPPHVTVDKSSWHEWCRAVWHVDMELLPPPASAADDTAAPGTAAAASLRRAQCEDAWKYAAANRGGASAWHEYARTTSDMIDEARQYTRNPTPDEMVRYLKFCAHHGGTEMAE